MNSYKTKNSIPYFSILGFVDVPKSVVVDEIIKIRKDLWDRLYVQGVEKV